MAEATFCTDCALLINNDEATDQHRARFAQCWGSAHTATCSTESYTDFADDWCDGCVTDAAGPRYHGTGH